MDNETLTQHQDTPVTKVTLVYGRDVKNLTEDQLITGIRRINKDIKDLEDMMESKRIQAKVASMEKAKAKLMKQLDSMGD